ncbi:MAG: hypothetical protein BWY75_01779 [bacterium ADurb.Bin425]|nr:MAG: hypothetical protein BWY75_01779 [bacterium ADurb.Bin425]
MGLGFFHKAAGIHNCLGDINLVAHERQIGHNHGCTDATGDCPCVVQHFFHGYGMGGAMTECHHSQAVAYQNEVYTGTVQNLGHRIIIGSQTNDLATVFLALLQS